MMTKKESLPKPNARSVMIVFVAIAIIAVVSMLIIYVRAGFNSRQNTRVEPTITYSTATPDESKENARDYQWRGTPSEPKKLVIESIGVDSFIQKVGVDQNKQVAVPSNIHLVGWFIDTVLPGENGLATIDGHVGGRTSPGVFENLATLKKIHIYH